MRKNLLTSLRYLVLVLWNAKKYLVPYPLIVLCLLFGASVFAKDMTSRLGVGFSNNFAVSPMPSLAVKYYPSSELALSAALGIDTNSTNSSSTGTSNFGFGAKIYKTVYPEDNLNFYMGAGAGLISMNPASGTGGTNNSGFELEGFCGVEVFIPGIDSVGFNFQAGVGIVSMSSGVRFRTIGDSPITGGMYFYF